MVLGTPLSAEPDWRRERERATTLESYEPTLDEQRTKTS